MKWPHGHVHDHRARPAGPGATAGVDTGIRLVTSDAEADHADLLARGVDQLKVAALRRRAACSRCATRTGTCSSSSRSWSRTARSASPLRRGRPSHRYRSSFSILGTCRPRSNAVDNHTSTIASASCSERRRWPSESMLASLWARASRADSSFQATAQRTPARGSPPWPRRCRNRRTRCPVRTPRAPPRAPQDARSKGSQRLLGAGPEVDDLVTHLMQVFRHGRLVAEARVVGCKGNPHHVTPCSPNVRALTCRP